MSTIDANSIVNTAYHGAVVGGISVLYSMLARKLFKIKPADLGKLDLEDSVKLSMTVGSALMTQAWLVKQGILPQNITSSSS